jgi:hypothetical protein
MRRKAIFSILSVALAMLAMSPQARADSWTFSLVPGNGAIYGSPSSTIGWGYTITNQSTTNWLMLTGLSADLFQNGTPGSLFDFPILPPASTITVAFNFGLGTGLYALTWDSTAPIGFTNSGTFVLNAEWWSGDPFAGGNFIVLSNDQSATYSATVTPVPEPASALLWATALGSLGVRKRRM